MTERSLGEGPDGSVNGSAARIASLTDEILPALIARLRASSLGELEIHADGWRVRLRREVAMPRVVSQAARDGASVAPASALAALEMDVARSPAVGYFTPARGLATGQLVRAGDVLGAVDILGVVQDVVAPQDGLVSRLLAEAGQAVEYGQPLVDIDAVDSAGGRRAGPTEAAPAGADD